LLYKAEENICVHILLTFKNATQLLHSGCNSAVAKEDVRNVNACCLLPPWRSGTLLRNVKQNTMLVTWIIYYDWQGVLVSDAGYL